LKMDITNLVEKWVTSRNLLHVINEVKYCVESSLWDIVEIFI
jgi:hypothetical protein